MTLRAVPDLQIVLDDQFATNEVSGRGGSRAEHIETTASVCQRPSSGSSGILTVRCVLGGEGGCVAVGNGDLLVHRLGGFDAAVGGVSRRDASGVGPS